MRRRMGKQQWRWLQHGVVQLRCAGNMFMSPGVWDFVGHHVKEYRGAETGSVHFLSEAFFLSKALEETPH